MRLRKKKVSKSIWKDYASWQLLILCIPAIAGYVLFNYIPMGAALVIPFKDYKFAKGIFGSDWCGLKNFMWLFRSSTALRALRNTAAYGLWFMIIGPVVNTIVALLLFEVRNRRALKTYQTIITFPNFMSMVIVGYVTYAFMSPQNGFINGVLKFFGHAGLDLYIKAEAWPAILTIVNIWKGVGMGSMVYFAALMGVDTSLYEAAEIDGANRLKKMYYISLPHLVPLVCIYTILNASDLVAGNFDLFYLIPRSSVTYSTTDVLSTYIYRALQDGHYAMGAATGLFQSVVGLALVVFANFIVKKISPDNSLF